MTGEPIVLSKAPALMATAGLVTMSDADPVRPVNNLKRAPEEPDEPRDRKRSRLDPGPAPKATKVSDMKQQKKFQW